MTKTCPRCQQPFACRPEAIHDCDCAKLTLTSAERDRIRAHTEQTLGGYVCLCNRCLTELAAQPLPSKNK
ncbi:cysteine-rich CWC family protein [Fibrella aestuarina]|uniref:cysteine-rich CWC family protein n=1 Tax=Fibrella aestuarina TaxID=651143 RepID=UPI0009FD6BF4|nr:cysteine-rich CWC family protein [Fibrella aestuarina]